MIMPSRQRPAASYDLPVAPGASPELSVVVPLFNEQENIPELYRRLTAMLPTIVRAHEIVLVNDGSKDSTGSMIDRLQREDPHVTAIQLSRNFGHQAAISAGIDHARGRAVVVMDGDLQDPPEALSGMLALWGDGAEVVYAIRTKRKEHWLKTSCYWLFYRVLNLLSDLEIPLDSGDFCLMDRKVVDALKNLPEQVRFVRGLRTFVGFRQVGYQYERDARAAGSPKYTLRALLGLAINGLISFSSRPLRFATYLGFTSALIALLLTIWIFIDAYVTTTTPRGWASTVVIVMFMGSMQLITLGIMGEYIQRIFVETKGRPHYIIRSIDRSDNIITTCESVRSPTGTSTDGEGVAALQASTSRYIAECDTYK
jgi:dolichol-phosphate mannosyltransferase